MAEADVFLKFGRYAAMNTFASNSKTTRYYETKTT